MSSKTERLVKDLAQLLIKYSLADWAPLIAQLEATGTHRGLAHAIERQLAQTAKIKRSRKTGTARPTPKKRATAPSAPPELVAFREALSSRRALPTSGDLRAGAEMIGMKEDLPTDRRRAVERLIAHLASLREEEATSALMRLAQADGMSKQDQGEEYQRWAALIMKR